MPTLTFSIENCWPVNRTKKGKRAYAGWDYLYARFEKTYDAGSWMWQAIRAEGARPTRVHFMLIPSRQLDVAVEQYRDALLDLCRHVGFTDKRRQPIPVVITMLPYDGEKRPHEWLATILEYAL